MAVITLSSPTKDSFLREGARNRNEGANPSLRIKAAGDNRALVAFDLSGMPVSRVTKATLILTAYENTGPGSTGPKFETSNWGNTGKTIVAHRLLTNWAEGNGKDADLPNNQDTRGTGSGVTWNLAIDTNISNHDDDGSPR